MITQNNDKKALVQDLLDRKAITAEQAYTLLDEQEQTQPQGLGTPITWPVYPQPYPYGWWGIYPPTCWPYGTICGDSLSVVTNIGDTTGYTITLASIDPRCITYTAN